MQFQSKTHRISTSSVVRASGQITEGRGFKPHPGLGIFQVFYGCNFININIILTFPHYYYYNTKLRGGIEMIIVMLTWGIKQH